jgi:hypothetical protein
LSSVVVGVGVLVGGGGSGFDSDKQMPQQNTPVKPQM